MRYLVLILSFVLGTLLNGKSLPEIHPYHVGAIEINYDIASQSFQITAKFFLDDLEDAVNLNQKNPYYFHQSSQKQEMYNALKNYILKHLLVKSNDMKVSFNFLGYEEDRESVYLYLESEKTPQPNKITVGANPLYNLYKDQINIVHIKIDGKRKSHKLEYPEIYLSVQF